VGDVQLARDDVIIEDLVPVEMNRRLTVPDEANSLLHECTDVEVVGVAGVYTDETDPTEFLGEEDHFVGSLGNIGLEHESLLNLVKEGLGLVKGGSVDTDWATSGLSD